MNTTGKTIRTSSKRRIVDTLGGLILIVVVVGLGWLSYYEYSIYHRASTPIPVPLSIRQEVNFTVYYPVQSKLPTGYTLDTNSFTGDNNVVVYVVRYGNQKLTFSVEQKPSNSDIQAFYAQHMPLHSTVSSPAGTAAIGSINNQTVVSLPTKTNAWLLITCPLNVNSQQLDQVIRSLKT